MADNTFTKADAVFYGKHANGCVIVDWRERSPGRHRAIRQHVFVQHRGDDKHGCGLMEDDCGLGLPIRCGYYRKHHPTMLAGADA